MNGGIRYHNRLRWLQYRILVKNLHTNDILSRYRRDVQNFCSFCTRERETISHLFYNCNIVREFYTTLSNLLLQLGLYFEINIKKCLFGNTNTKNDSFENLLLLYCKGYIWCCKYRNTLPTLAGFKLYVCQYLKTLQVIYTIQSRSDNFVLTWGILYGHLVAGAELPDTQPPPGPNLPVQDGAQD